MPSARLARASLALAAPFALLACVLPAPAWAEASVVTLTPASVPTGRTAVPLPMPAQRSGDLSYTAVLHYATQDGTAQAGVDYDGAGGGLQFLAGETEHNILLNILPHPAPGADNDFQLHIISAVGVGALPHFSPSSAMAGEAVSDFAVADFNGDGKPDVAAVGAKLAVLINTTPAGATTATYAGQLSLTLPNSPCCVITADFNADHRPDLAVLDGVGNIAVLLNTTTPGAATATFSAQPTLFAAAVAIAAADLDGDGRPELVATTSGSAVRVFPNPPTGFDSGTLISFTVGAPQNQLLLVDINGDGAIDIVASQTPQQLLAVLVSTATPGTIDFQPVQFLGAGASPVSLAQADLNGDGHPDVLVANTTGAGAFSVLFNTTPAGSSTVTTSGNFFLANGMPDAFAMADLNGDGHADLIELINGQSAPFYRLGRTAPTATTADFTSIVPAVGSGWGNRRVVVSDVNGDGLPDLIGVNGSSNGIAVALQTAPASAPAFGFTGQTAVTAGFAAQSIAVADFNLDGRIDVASANYNSNTVSMLFNTTAPGATTPQFATPVDLPGGGDPNAVVAGDLNGDGKPDLVHAGNFSGSLLVDLNTTPTGNTTPSFAAQVGFAVAAPTALALADINGDGKLDLVAAQDDPGNQVGVLLNTMAVGATTPGFSAAFPFATDARPNALAVSDLNGDGKPDLMLTSFTANTVSILLNSTPLGSSSPTFLPKQTLATGSIPTAVASADLNGDGRPDLLAINSDTHPPSLRAWINTTPLVSNTASFAAPLDFPISIASSAALTLADVDGDGRIDAIVANYASQHVAVLRNITTPGATSASFAAQRTFATPAATTAVAVGDLNGDGKPDVVAGNLNVDKLSVFLNSQIQVTTTGSPATVTLHNNYLFGNGFE